MTDLKMREEFEVWAVSQCSSIKRSVAMPERYATDFTQGAWLGWQASRAAVVIELPEPATPETFGVTQANDPDQYEELKALAEAVAGLNKESGYPWEQTISDGRLGKTSTAYALAASPTAILALIEEVERLDSSPLADEQL